MTRKKSHKPKGRTIIFSLALSAAALLFGLISLESVDVQQLFSKLFWPLLRVLFFIGIGLIVGQIIEATGWTRILAAVALPAFRFGNLGVQCSAAFTAAFFSGVAANAMLLDFYKEELINRRQLFLANFINQFPAFFLHLPTTFFIVIPLTGWAGALYFLLTFSATVVRTVAFLVYGHFLVKPPQNQTTADFAGANSLNRHKTLRDIWQTIKGRLPTRLANIAVYVVPIYITVYFLNAMGIFDQIRQGLALYVTSAVVPIESLSVVILSFAAEFTSGFAAAGALMAAGALTVKQTVVALLIGNIVAFPIRALRHQLPHYMGIYSPRTGLQLLLMGQGFRVVSIILIGSLYYLLF